MSDEDVSDTVGDGSDDGNSEGSLVQLIRELRIVNVHAPVSFYQRVFRYIKDLQIEDVTLNRMLDHVAIFRRLGKDDVPFSTHGKPIVCEMFDVTARLREKHPESYEKVKEYRYVVCDDLLREKQIKIEECVYHIIMTFHDDGLLYVGDGGRSHLCYYYENVTNEWACGQLPMLRYKVIERTLLALRQHDSILLAHNMYNKKQVGICSKVTTLIKNDAPSRRIHDEFDKHPVVRTKDGMVYCIDTKEVRPATMADMCRKTLGCMWASDEPDPIRVVDVAPTQDWLSLLDVVTCPAAAELHEFLSDVFVDESIRDYFLVMCSTYLHRTNYMKKVSIWLGRTNNGKSVTGNLLKRIFGDYSTSSSTVLSTKSRNGNAATPLMAGMDQTSLLFVAEPEVSVSLKASVIKSLSGNDGGELGRGLYEQARLITVNPAVVIQTNNVLTIDNIDKATAGRLLIIPFLTTFDDTVIPDNKYSRSRNPKYLQHDEFCDRVGWVMLRLLVRIHQLTSNPLSLPVPLQIREATLSYIRESNSVLSFVLTHIVPSQHERIEVQEAYIQYTRLHRGKSADKVSREQFRKCVASCFDIDSTLEYILNATFATTTE
jgi:hypothetical protein